jgi:hypothetical protein
MLGKFLFTRHRKERKEGRKRRGIKKERKIKGRRGKKGNGGVVRLTSFPAVLRRPVVRGGYARGFLAILLLLL